MIPRFEEHSEAQYQGRIGQTASQDNSVTKTTDLVVSGKEHWKDVDNNLFRWASPLKNFAKLIPILKDHSKIWAMHTTLQSR